MQRTKHLSLWGLTLTLIFVFWSVTLLLTPAHTIQTVFQTEAAGCLQVCSDKIEGPLQKANDWFSKLKGTVRFSLQATPLAPAGLSDIDANVRNTLWRFLSERLHAAQNLLALLLLRMALFENTLLLLLLFEGAVIVDALTLRTIAHHTFETSRPAVSFLSAKSFFAAVGIGFALMFVPVVHAAFAGLLILTVGSLGLHFWVRYFHRL